MQGCDHIFREFPSLSAMPMPLIKFSSSRHRLGSIASRCSGNEPALLPRESVGNNLSIRLFFLAGKEKIAPGKEKPDIRVFIAVFYLLLA